MSKNRFTLGLSLVALLLSLSPVATFAIAKEHEPGADEAKGRWTIATGYGVTHPGLGATESTVEAADIILSYSRFLTGEIGKSWYRGRHEFIFELPLHYVFSPETTPMFGVTFLACWTFTASDIVTPYIFAGGGLVYTDLKVPELGRKLNGTHQAGAGIHYFFRKNASLDFSYRFHHISNAGTAEPNGPLNSNRMLFGLSFFH